MGVLVMQSKYSKRTILWVVPILLIVALIYYFRPASDQDTYIQAAKDYAIPAHEGITFEQSLSKNCSKGEWSFFETNRGQKVVEFSGDCAIGNAQKFNLQFLLEDDLSIEIGALLVDYDNIPDKDKPAIFEQLVGTK